MKYAKMRAVLCVLSILLLKKANGQCSVDIPDAERRDCFPWTGGSQSVCEARGCVWCPTTAGFPYCFYNDKVCPSTIAEATRTDCHPEQGSNKAVCLSRGCTWCETSTPNIPWCFHDSVSQGGQNCTSGIPDNERIDCHPESDLSTARCLARSCFYCQSSTPGVPWCFMPKSYGYRMVGTPISTPKGFRVNLSRVNHPSWFGEEINNVRLEAEFQTNQRLRLKFFDPNNARYETPVQIQSPSGQAPSPLYDVQFVSSPVFGVRVTRRSSGAVIFDSTIGGFQFSEQFIQIATRLSSQYVYGFGEQEHHSFAHNMQWQKWGMWARDQAVTNANLYGVHPFYMNIDGSSSAHGVLFLNSNAQDVTLSPAPALHYRTTGGVLDIYFFLGPDPESVTQQYHQAIGLPAMVPYWGLGFHLCRWGYRDLDHMKQAIARMRQYDIPHDVQYGDIDYMDARKDFTIDPQNWGGLPSYVQELKTQGTRFVIILDPAIASREQAGTYPPFEDGQRDRVWITRPDGSTAFEGRVWPGYTFFPDYFKQSAKTWWINQCVQFRNQLEFEGLWIDMNEPANFENGDVNTANGCDNNKWNNPPFKPHINMDQGQSFYFKSACGDTRHESGTHYNLHSVYGYSMAVPSFDAARQSTGKRSIVYGRSTFPGTGKFAHHWLGDNWSRWSNLRYSIIGMLEFNFFGMPFVGPDTCGFNEQTTEEMCNRWQSLGAFYPFSRNHNAEGNPDQDPGMWPSVAAAAKKYLNIRYTLLPYLYTLFHHVHIQGGTVARPLLNEFIGDVNARNISDQFLWGSAFMVSPVLTQGATNVDVYFPDARWFDYQDGYELSTRLGTTRIASPLGHLPLYLRGGYILPTQEPANSTLFSRDRPMGLTVTLDDSGAASGNLFWDDGDTQDTYEKNQYFYETFSCSNKRITNTIVTNGYDVTGSVMNTVRLLGDKNPSVTEVRVNNVVFTDWQQNATSKEVTIRNLGLAKGSTFTITWATS